MRLIAYNIRSLHNVGAIFRSAGAFGVAMLYLSGYTPTPPRKEIAKVALGAERLVPWRASDVHDAIRECKAEGYLVCALEQTSTAIPLNTLRATKPVAFLLGNEVEGIPADILALCDVHVVIPMQEKRSLNVSVATGVALWEIARTS